MSAPLKRFEVMVTSWQAHTIAVAAAGATEAEEEAVRLWTEADVALFTFKDGGLNGVFVEEVQP